MNNLQMRLLITFASLYAVILAALGLVLGQLFPNYIEKTVNANTTIISEKIHSAGDISQHEIAEMIQHGLLEEGFQKPTWHLWLLVSIALVIVFVILVILTHFKLNKLLSSVEHVANTAEELTKGNYRARAHESIHSPTIELSKSINALAHNLQEITQVREIEKERLKTLIDNMGSALIMIGRKGEVSVVNDSFLTLFEKKQEDVHRQVFRKLGIDENLEEFVDHVFMTETSYRKQVQIIIDQQLKHMEVYGAPVIGKHGRWLGVVIVMHDITELKKLEQVRKDFVANVSHELRTPITSIKGFAETLIDGAYQDEETLLSFLDIMYKESNRLQMLVQDLLELSKIEKEGFKINVVPASLNTAIMRSLENARIAIEEKRMEVHIHADQEVIVNGDANRLIQVFVNLLVNAATYSTAEKEINITIGTTGKYGFVEIDDQGIGMAKAEIPRVFERFYRVDRARSRNSGGTGLGLAIVKHLIEVHEGRIFVKSEEGTGTKVKVLIPLNEQ